MEAERTVHVGLSIYPWGYWWLSPTKEQTKARVEWFVDGGIEDWAASETNWLSVIGLCTTA